MTSLTRASVKNRLLVALLTAAVALFGLISMGALKQELMPSMTVPMAAVSFTSDGLSSAEMSRSVTEPAEKALMTIPGVKNVTSTTSAGSSLIQVEWAFGKDDEETLRTLRSTVDALKPVLPTGSESQVLSGGMDGMPAMVVSVASTKDDPAFGETIQTTVVPALQGVAGVQRVEVAGRDEQRIVIALRAADVARLKVEPAGIPAALQAFGATASAGEVAGADGKVSVTVGQGLGSVEDIQALPIATADGVVAVADFADVALETVPQGSLSRVNGKSALTLQILPAQGANVVDISHGVNAELDRLAPTLRADFVTVFDQAPYIEQSIKDLSVEGGLGLICAVLVILAFLGSWRSTIIAAVSIPLSLLITLIGLLWSGNTLNVLTLGALTIAIGRVVDDSIVVIENITRRRGSGPLTIEGVVASVRQVAGAITASTLTTVAVFAPIALVSGLTGQLFRPFAITVTIALLASLLVALTVVPVLAYWFLRNRPAHGAATEDATTSAEHEDDLSEIHTRPDRLQGALMPALAATRRHPIITVAAASVILVATLGMSSLLRTDFLGSSGAETLQLVQTPPTDAKADPLEVVEPVERALAEVKGVRDVITAIPVAKSGERMNITYDVMLAKGATVEQVRGDVDKALKSVKNAGDVQVVTQDSFAAGGAMTLQIRGNDADALAAASDQLQKRLADADGVQSVRSDAKGEQTVVRVQLDKMLAARLGFDPGSIAQTIHAALEGQTVGQIVLDGREHAILVRTPGMKDTADALSALMLPVTPQQTAEARKVAQDQLTAKAEAEMAQARSKAESQLNSQISDAADQRAQLVSQSQELNAQLQALAAAPIVPAPYDDLDEEAVARAHQERAEQLAALQGAIAGMQDGIAGIDTQMSSLRDAQREASDAAAAQDAATQEQRAAMDITGAPIPLSAIATVTEEKTAPTITRANGERQVELTIEPKKGAFDAADAAMQDAIAEAELPAGVSFVVGGVGADQDEAFAQLGLAMLAAILLVLLVMVATFRSFRGPLVLLISIPFAATGALLGLLLTDTALGLPAMIGLLMLIGIVVTNAIVLMDLVGRLRAAGATLDEAIEHGTRLRLRPILMTAAATIFALVPMALGLTGGGVFISKPLAIVVIGGLISSTLLTLILVPILYGFVERRHDRAVERRLARREARQARAQRDSEVQMEELLET